MKDEGMPDGLTREQADTFDMIIEMMPEQATKMQLVVLIWRFVDMYHMTDDWETMSALIQVGIREKAKLELGQEAEA